MQAPAAPRALTIVLATLAMITSVFASNASQAATGGVTPWQAGDPTVVPPSKTVPKQGVNYHGLWADHTPAVRAKLLDEYAAAGVEYVRFDIAWNNIQPTGPGSYDMSYWVPEIDKRLQEISDRGMKALLLFYWAPAWSSGTTEKNGVPRDPEEYGTAAAWAANRWKDKLVGIELWNEPDLSAFLSNTSPVTYTNLVKAAYPKIKAVAPNVTVVAGAPTYVKTDWYAQFYANGGAGNYDALGIHPYMGISDKEPTYCETNSNMKYYPCNIPNLINLMQANGDGDKTLWATEYGWSSHNNSTYASPVPTWKRGVTESQQAEYYIAMQNYLSQWPQVEAAFWYNEWNKVTGDAMEDNFGMLNRDYTRKPVYYAIKCATSGVCGPNATTPDTPTNLVTTSNGMTSISLAWAPSTTASAYSVFQDGTQIGTTTKAQYLATNLTPNTAYTYTVKATNASGESQPSNSSAATTASAPPATYANTGKQWRYNDKGIDLGTSWRSETFDDSGWTSGPTQLGYGDGDEATTVSYGSNATSKHITTYARTTFDAGNSVSNITGLNLKGIFDDGAIVYLNGSEIWRYNMPTGVVGFSTRSATTIAAPTESAWQILNDVSSTALKPGVNTLAVEVHQDLPSSSDISLDLNITPIAATTKPGTPSELAASDITRTSVALVWNSVPTAASYKLFRDGVKIAEGTNTTHIDTGLSANSTHSYTVKATNAGGDSLESAPISVTTLPAAPTTPTGLNGATRSQTAIDLSWDATPNSTSYKVFRDGVKIGEPPTNTFQDTGLTAGTIYTYTVKAANPGGDSPASAPVNATTHPLAPAKPSNVVATVNSQTKITLTWGQVDRAAKYDIYRNNIKVGQTADTTFPDENLTSNTSYTYTVKAINAGGESEHSDSVTATTPVDAPAAPTGLTSNSITATSINLSWAAAPGATGYEVYRNNTKIATIPTGTSYANTGLTSSTTYTYSVVAINAGGSSPHSASHSVTTLDTAPTAPTGVAATANSQTKVTITWSPVPTATSYEIFRGTSLVGSSTSNTFANTGLTANTSYTYTVKAKNAVGTSVASAGAAVKTPPNPPAAPTGVKAAAQNSTTINVTWIAASGATSYKVFRNGTQIGTSTTLNYMSTGLAPNTTYSFTVKAVNAGGDSAASTTATATTPKKVGVYIPRNATWKYNGTGANLGTTWRNASYSDTTWKTGLAELGYGDGDEQTVVDYTTNASGGKNITTYYRSTFDASTLISDVKSIKLEGLFDDGAIVYLNGTEVWRYNMPTGTIANTTRAASTIMDAGETTWQTKSITTTGLKTGVNTIAVEVHQDVASSSDTTMNFSITPVR